MKDPILAALLAWLVPGLGHWYQGRRAKAVLFFVCIMGLFVYGVFLGGGYRVDDRFDPAGKERFLGYGRAVYFSWQNDDKRLYYVSQIGVGLAAMPALFQANWMNRHEKVGWYGRMDGFMAPPRPVQVPLNDPNENQPTAHDLHYLLNRSLELATIFTAVAGLLNVLAIYDAWAGPVVMQPPAKKEDEEKEEAEEEEKEKEEVA
jgi:hypothetical protein